MDRIRYTLVFAVLLTLSINGVGHSDVMISELEPDPVGSPGQSTVELLGTPGDSFDVFLVFLENDGGFNDGFVDTVHNAVGTFDSNGIATTTFALFEAPSFTLVVSESNPESDPGNTDLDSDNDGVIDNLAAFGQIHDSLGVSDSLADNSSLYSNSLGGSSILSQGAGDPNLVFRDSENGQFFQYFIGGPGVFAADGTTLFSVDDFSTDPTVSTFGAVNPTITAIPEPSSLAMIALVGIGFLQHRRRV